MIDGVEFGVFPEWLALPLDVSDADLESSLLDRFRADPKPDDVKRAIAQGLVTLRRQLTGTSDDQTQVFTVWVLLPLGGESMAPRAVAHGSIMRVTRGTEPMELVDTIIAGAPLHQPVDLQEIASPLGTAHVMRGRLFAENEHGIELSEIISIFWLPEDDDIAILMSSLPIDDLVLAADVAEAMTGLAETAQPASPAGAGS